MSMYSILWIRVTSSWPSTKHNHWLTTFGHQYLHEYMCHDYLLCLSSSYNLFFEDKTKKRQDSELLLLFYCCFYFYYSVVTLLSSPWFIVNFHLSILVGSSIFVFLLSYFHLTMPGSQVLNWFWRLNCFWSISIYIYS